MNEEKINKTIGNNITYYLKATGRSMTDLAKYLNVSQTSVSNWCKGVKIPRMDKIDKICSYFQVSRSDIMDDFDYVAKDTEGNEILVEHHNVREEAQKFINKRLFAYTAGLEEHFKNALDLYDKFERADNDTKDIIIKLLKKSE